MPRKKSKSKVKPRLKWGRKSKFIISICGLVITIVLIVCYSLYLKSQPYIIGVLLPLTGPDAGHYEEILEWTKNEYENAVGSGDKKIQFVFKDTAKGKLEDHAKSLLSDRNIKIVIGPYKSGDMMEVAPLFIKEKKLLISPTTTAADIYRAYADSDYIWRTVQSDVAQVRTIMYELQKKNVSKVALIYDPSPYGKTFYDWTGFFATEANISVTSIQALTNDHKKIIANALSDSPEYIIAVTYPEDTVTIKKQLDNHVTSTKLFLTDSSQVSHLVEELGDSAEGLESTGVAYDPGSNFAELFAKNIQDEEPHGFTASIFDAAILAILTSVRNDYASPLALPLISEDISKSFKSVVHSKGEVFTSTNLPEIIEQIKVGETPKYKGYSGSMNFDRDYGVDPLDSFYSYQIVRNGQFETEEIVSSNTSLHLGVADEDSSALLARGADSYARISDNSGTQKLKDKKGLKAVIVSASHGWENYRHQSDAVAIYQLLKQNGVSDDDIILFLVDDVANAKANKSKGSLYHIEGGKNNYEGVVIDYRGDEVNVENLENVLLGIDSDDATNILLYITNHGGDISSETAGSFGGDFKNSEGYITFTNSNVGSSRGLLTSQHLSEIVDEMKANMKFRQMLILIEACFSGAMGSSIDQEGVLFMSAASASEVSYGTNYHRGIKQWLANQFTYQLIEEAKKNPKSSLADYYYSVYKNVPGSHVTLLNYGNFGNTHNTSISEFVTP